MVNTMDIISNKKNIVLVVLNYNDVSTTVNFVNMIRNYDSIDHIVVVDNNSTDNSFSILQKYKSEKIDVIQTNYNGGYGYGNNYGINYSNIKYNPEYIIISNPDVEFDNLVVYKLIDAVKDHNDYAIAAPMMLDIEGNNLVTAWKLPNAMEYILSSSLIYNKYFKPLLYKEDLFMESKVAEVDCVAGSFLMVDTKKIIEIGLYDTNIFLYGEETSLGFKLKKHNYKTILVSDIFFKHNHSTSISKTIKSNVQKKAMVNKSRYYILLNYLNINIYQMVFTKMFYTLTLFEYSVYNTINNIKRLFQSYLD